MIYIYALALVVLLNLGYINQESPLTLKGDPFEEKTITKVLPK